MTKNLCGVTIAAVSALSLNACSSSDILKVNDTYTIFKEGGTPVLGQQWRLSSLKPEALREAIDLCSRQGKEVGIIKEDAIPMSIGVFAQYHLTFKCE